MRFSQRENASYDPIHQHRPRAERSNAKSKPDASPPTIPRWLSEAEAPTKSLMSKETLFALSLFPYLGFLWFLTQSAQTPKLALRGFYFLLVFVFVTIPAGIYAKTQYNAELANVDWLHGSAESFLTLTNILVVIGFQQAIQAAKSDQTPNP
jgi:Protein of unknown function (DUF3593)